MHRDGSRVLNLTDAERSPLSVRRLETQIKGAGDFDGRADSCPRRRLGYADEGFERPLTSFRAGPDARRTTRRSSTRTGVHRHSAFVAPWLLRFFRQSGHGLGPQRRPLRVHWFFADRYQPCAVAATGLALPQRDTTRQIMTLVAELVVDHHLAFGVLRTAWRRVRVRSSTYLNNVVEQDHRAGRMDYKLVSAA